MNNPTITITSKTGRKATGNQRSNIVTHAKLYGSNKALCGTEPGRLSSWSEYPTELPYINACQQAGKLITCKQCKKALYKLFDKPQFGCSHVR